jgi:SAM-dependent methyltransferase
MANKYIKGDTRTIEQLREHYNIEIYLANILRNASAQERRNLYTTVYNELYRRVPLHPQLTRMDSPNRALKKVNDQLIILKPFLTEGTTFLEVGPGDCALSLEVCKYVNKVYSIDVSDEISKNIKQKQNFHFILSDGCDIPVPKNSVDVAYSNSLIEHLHPDDAIKQLQNIYNALTLGGIYLCITPNKLGGPHDISKYFDDIATGFHMKEYTIFDLNSLFIRTGFKKNRIRIGAKKYYVNLPILMVGVCESILNILPKNIRKYLIHHMPFKLLLTIRILGVK